LGRSLRGDLELAALAQHQAEWIIGRNPFSQSTMYGEGYDFPPLYAPFPGNIVGALPVGLQTRGDRDVPYWPVQSTWTYKEVWVHPVGRWIWLMEDLLAAAPMTARASDFSVTSSTAANGEVTLRLTSTSGGPQSFAVRSDNLTVDRPIRSVQGAAGKPMTIEWKARPKTADISWVAVVIPNGDVSRRREVVASAAPSGPRP